MVNTSQISEWSVRTINVVLLILIVSVLCRYIYLAWLQYKRGALYELEQKEKEQARRLKSMSTNDLVEQANNGLGVTRKPKTD